MERITITIDDELLATVDSLVAKRGCPSRSEAIRDLMREGAKHDHAGAGRAPCVAALSYVFDHGTRELSQRLANAQHDHHDLGISTMHVHFDHDSCLEVAILRGPADAIQKLANSLTAQRGVRYTNLHMIPLRPSVSRHRHGPGTTDHSHNAI